MKAPRRRPHHEDPKCGRCGKRVPRILVAAHKLAEDAIDEYAAGGDTSGALLAASYSSVLATNPEQHLALVQLELELLGPPPMPGVRGAEAHPAYAPHTVPKGRQ
jgi:hypothetical protein